MPFYEVVAYSRAPQQTTEPSLNELGRIITLGGESSGASGGLSWSRELCSDGFITVATSPEELIPSVASRMKDLLANPIELYLYRDGVLRQRGPLISWQIEGNTLVLQARGLLYYLRYMVLTSDFTFDKDQAFIVEDMIDHHQNKDYGDFGLDASGITSHGVTRKRVYKKTELINVQKEIRDMSEADDGFDMDINPTTRAITLHNPQMGTDKSASVFLDARGMTDPNYAYSLAAGRFGTAASASGTSDDNAAKWAEAFATTPRTTFGLAYVTTHVLGATSFDEVQSYADQAVNLARNPYFVPSRNYFPVVGASIDDFDQGDKVSFVFDPGFGEFTIAQDVKSINISVSPDGNEKLNVEFV